MEENYSRRTREEKKGVSYFAKPIKLIYNAYFQKVKGKPSNKRFQIYLEKIAHTNNLLDDKGKQFRISEATVGKHIKGEMTTIHKSTERLYRLAAKELGLPDDIFDVKPWEEMRLDKDKTEGNIEKLKESTLYRVEANGMYSTLYSLDDSFLHILKEWFDPIKDFDPFAVGFFNKLTPEEKAAFYCIKAYDKSFNALARTVYNKDKSRTEIVPFHDDDDTPEEVKATLGEYMAKDVDSAYQYRTDRQVFNYSSEDLWELLNLQQQIKKLLRMHLHDLRDNPKRHATITGSIKAFNEFMKDGLKEIYNSSLVSVDGYTRLDYDRFETKVYKYFAKLDYHSTFSCGRFCRVIAEVGIDEFYKRYENLIKEEASENGKQIDL